MARLRCYARLHWGLLDLAHATRNRYGGGGLALQEPFAEITANVSQRNTIWTADPTVEIAEIKSALDRYLEVSGCATEIRIDVAIPAHQGFGSKTASVLGSLAAARVAHGRVDSDERLKLLSGRGGTSGIGINSFFTGGFLIDCGRKDEPEEPFGPSSSLRPPEIPKLLCRYEFPQAWRILLVKFSSPSLYGSDERLFFQENTPIDRDESSRSISIMHHTIAPAVAAADLHSVADGLREFAAVGFKAREISSQSSIVRECFSLMQECPSAAVGLSSLGPTIFGIFEQDRDDILDYMIEITRRFPKAIAVVTMARNSGYLNIG